MLLQQTNIYGAGRDATLTRIAQLASRWGRFPLPRGANGLRQPVHTDDLAAAAFACANTPATQGQTYALPGGETLTYRDMVARVLASLNPGSTAAPPASMVIVCGRFSRLISRLLPTRKI